MKIILFPLLAVVFLTGCSSRYVITLNNRSQIVAMNKPVLKNGAYVYKDSKGQEAFISAGRVTEVCPASMVQKDQFRR